MRIRVLESRANAVDGVDLSLFHAGHVYEVDPSIATFLIVSGMARPATDGAPALVVRNDEILVGLYGGAGRPVIDVADEWDDWDDDVPPQPGS
jgi:hypothetical protein